ncbi:Xaa-Pro dipeptidyl-peptidase [Liquorilactobacillus sicerae]|uniref:Xaa-Pro dipeptidyl-peptidase n=1 Tax=Liquorilactobacillus sicerae TaxID=1416943 RepID=UPI0024811EB7|nr:Xaa-Pro dipeptidyl-peptidase [Liquorilactobacillus sicerae]
MYNNQFARLKLSLLAKIAELKKINFLDDQLLTLHDPTELWQQFIGKAFPQAKSLAAKQAKLASLAATADENLLTYLKKGQRVTATSFYNVALQLLGFLPVTDFELDQPLKMMRQTNLPYSETLKTVQDVIAAWYDLLTTSTKLGQTWLDKLAGSGYFAKWQNVTQPLFFNGKAQPIFATSKLLYETVYVETDLDTDEDGQADLVKVDLIRPSETQTGLQVPVLFTASPYNQGTNDEAADKLMHKMNVPLTHKKPGSEDLTPPKFPAAAPTKRTVSEVTPTAQETFSDEFGYSLNDYFLARGFAVVYSAGIGTKDSDGLRTCGTAAETQAAKAVVEWLHGDRVAFVSRSSQQAIKAWWSNGQVAMTGKSYLGTLATAVATTGVKGLKTVIAEAAISSWYDYYRDGGLVVAPGGFPGEDADVLALECQSRQQVYGDFLRVKQTAAQKLSAISTGQDRSSGNYNAFWDQRNYLKDFSKIKADVVLVHGLNDWNVKLRNAYQAWEELQKLPISQKLILHQGKHIYINHLRSLDFTDLMNLWLSYELYGVANQAPQIIPQVLVQDNTQVEKWQAYANWSAAKTTKLYLQPAQLTTDRAAQQVVSFKDQLPAEKFAFYQQQSTVWKHDLLEPKSASPLQNHKLIFTSQPLPQDVLLRGVPHVKLKVAVNSDHGLLSLMLVDYGQAKRLRSETSVLSMDRLQLGYHWQTASPVDFRLEKNPSPWKMLTKGHLNLQNRQHPWQVDELKANTFYSLQVDLQPMFYHLPAGRQLGLIVYATDFGMTVCGNQELTYSLQLADCQLELPVSKL